MVLLIPFCTGWSLLSAQTTSILWLGNSYTATNNLPDMLSQLALSGGDSMYYDSNTPGGYTFQLHWDDAYTHSKINQQQWDYVVLQAQSQEPSLDSVYVSWNVYPYARALDSVIHVNDSCTQTIFYMTWGRKNGDAQNCAAYPAVCTYQGMQDQLRNRYLQMGYDNGAMVAPCGEAWRDVIATTPTFDLYIADESHPSVYGTYLNACVFYASIYRRSPVGLTYTAGLPAADALFLQQYAASTVLDSMLVWNTEVYYDDASFDSTLTAGTTYAFTSLDSSMNHQWNFGNGFVPGNANEVYTFPGNGIYTVTHVTTNACLSDTVTMVIAIGPQSIASNCAPEKVLEVFPSPADESVTVRNPFAPDKVSQLEITDFAGNKILQADCTEREIHISVNNLPEGFYFISVRCDGESVTTRIVVSHH
jgi:hypothetical protein